jgi:hypothetical protein
VVAVDASMVVAPAGALAVGSLVAAVVDATAVVCSALAGVAALVAGASPSSPHAVATTASANRMAAVAPLLHRMRRMLRPGRAACHRGWHWSCLGAGTYGPR